MEACTSASDVASAEKDISQFPRLSTLFLSVKFIFSILLNYEILI